MINYFGKVRVVLLVSVLLETAVALPQATAKFDKDLERLQEARDKAVARAVEPIDRKFKEQLQALMAKATAGGDLETALLIKKKIELLGGQGGEIVIEDTVWKNKRSKLYFRKGGEYEEEGFGSPGTLTWERISAAEIEVTHRDGRKNTFILSEKGDTVTRKADGMVWTLDKK